jgi:hypothetical protein
MGEELLSRYYVVQSSGEQFKKRKKERKEKEKRESKKEKEKMMK